MMALLRVFHRSFFLRFARFARLAVFFDGAYRAVWVQIRAFNVHFCKSMQLRAL